MLYRIRAPSANWSPQVATNKVSLAVAVCSRESDLQWPYTGLATSPVGDAFPSPLAIPIPSSMGRLGGGNTVEKCSLKIYLLFIK